MKNILTQIGLAVLITALLAVCYEGCQHLRKENKDLHTVGRQLQYDSVRHYRDLYGKERAVTSLQQGSIATLKAFHGRELDSVLTKLRLREKQLSSMSTVLAQAQGRIVTNTEYVHDTIPGTDIAFNGQYFTYDDSCLALAGYVDSNRAIIDYSFSIKLDVATYWRRKWFLGRKRYYIDAGSPQSNIHITGLSGYKVN